MRTGKLWELAAIADMPSQPTLRAFIRARPDFPVIEVGRKGSAYLFDLDAAAAFVRAHWSDQRAEFSGSARSSRHLRQAASGETLLPGLFASDDGKSPD